MPRQKTTDRKWRQHAETLEFETEEEMLRQLMAEKSTREIAKRLGYSRFAIMYRLKLYGIKNPRGPGGPNYTKEKVAQDFSWREGQSVVTN